MFQPDFIAGLRRWSFGVLAFIFALFLFFSSDHVSVYQVENEVKCDSLYYYASGNTDEGSISSDDLKDLGDGTLEGQRATDEAERSAENDWRHKCNGIRQSKMTLIMFALVLGSTVTIVVQVASRMPNHKGTSGED